MAKSRKKRSRKATPEQSNTSELAQLKGWQQISTFLSQPVAVAQRWARTSGMPVTRQGRYVTATPEELNGWLGREAGGEPLQVATPEADLASALKRGLAYVRQKRKQ